MVHSFHATVAEARRHGNLYFAALLSQDRILKAFEAARTAWQGWVYTPAITVWVFLSQCLSPDHSCRDAVARLVAWRLAAGLSPCSADTGAYCTARGDLPEEALARVGARHRPAGRGRIAGRLGFGTDGRFAWWTARPITMPDTPENQAAYPQQKTQKPGCGFPIARILVIFSLSVGTVLEAAIGKYEGKQTGENSLFRGLYDALAEGDVILADRYFSGWCDIAFLVKDLRVLVPALAVAGGHGRRGRIVIQLQRPERQAADLAFPKAGPSRQHVHHGPVGPGNPLQRRNLENPYRIRLLFSQTRAMCVPMGVAEVATPDPETTGTKKGGCPPASAAGRGDRSAKRSTRAILTPAAWPTSSAATSR